MQRIHSIIPLAVLKAMQEADHLPEVAGEPFGDLASVRLGGSDTIAAQVNRYQASLDKGEMVPADDVRGLLQLVARRPDADLVLADAGRIAGQMAVQRHGGVGSAVSKLFGSRGAMRTARKVSRDVFDCSFEEGHRIWWADSAELGRGNLAGATCRMTGAGVGEVLHVVTGYEGALLHEACRKNGGGECAWVFDAEGF